MKRQILYILILFAAALSACGSSAITNPDTSLKRQTVGDDTDVVDSVSEMTLGDIYYIDFDGTGNASVDFAGASTEAKYILVIQSTESTATNVSVVPTKSSQITSITEFDNWLRENEAVTAMNEVPEQVDSPVSKSISKVSMGDTRSFKVLTNISQTNLTETIDAKVRCVEDEVIVYTDLDIGTDLLSDSDMATLCSQFEYAVSTEETIVGNPSDVNADGHVVVVITPAVNRLGASGNGIITGYFYSADLYPTSQYGSSNEMEVVYVLSPDPDKSFGSYYPISKDFALSNYMPAVVPHEVQHAINYNQHVFINRSSSEKSWLNEGISHLMEDITGFGVENPARVKDFLDDPSYTSLTPTSSPNLAQRGLSYLFLRFLYERSSDADLFLASLVDTSNTGITNIELAFGEEDPGFDEWTEFLRRLGIAIVLTNTGISTTSQYQFNTQVENSITGNPEGICLICNADDNRPTVLAGPVVTEISSTTLSVSLTGNAMSFYSIETPLSTLDISGGASSGLQGILIRSE